MHSIFLSLLLLVTGLFAGGAAHAEPQAFLAAADRIEPSVLRAGPAPVLANLRKCMPHPAQEAATPGIDPAVLAAHDCGAPSQVTLDDRHEMIWLDSANKELALAYLSPRNAVSSRGSPAAWLRMPLRPPRA
jgi:hypothetical protein